MIFRPASFPHPANPHRHCADPGLNLVLGQITMPDQPLAASGIGPVSMGGRKSAQRSLDCQRDQLPRTAA